jgi:hypothetical protein
MEARAAEEVMVMDVIIGLITIPGGLDLLLQLKNRCPLPQR